MTGVDRESDGSHEVQKAEFHGYRSQHRMEELMEKSGSWGCCSGQDVPAHISSIPPFHRFSGWFAVGVYVFHIT